jgi:3'-phosphoadenosine 5'-phosphosulfate sulfotransferase (PAPS reductase)/FAD synthetase
MPTKQDLKILQALPLEVKIQKTKQRIKEWIDFFGIDGVYVSFSGGKDSTVLLDLVRQDYPQVEAVFADTGLEYPEIREFVKGYDNVTWVKPKMRFDEVIKTYGFPLVSKEVALNIYYGRTALLNGDIDRYNHCINGFRHNKKTGKDYIYMPLPKLWIPLFNSNIPVSHYCCVIMKKEPSKRYEKETGRHPYIGEMASDSKVRETQYLKTSCNAFNSKRPISKPMGFWTEQDVLQYIKMYNIEICSV